MTAPDLTVTVKAARPAGKPDECFYCQQKVGAQHRPECVLVKRKVRLRLTVEFTADVPAHWDKEQIEFHRNESSWCANNALTEIYDQYVAEGTETCMCEHSHVDVLELLDDVSLSEG